MKDIWFTSDWHLGHENIINLCKRPFKSVEEMDETIIGNFNDTVKEGDLVYHLGDVFWKAMNYYIKAIKKVEMYCLKGNHDASNSAYFGKEFDTYLEVSARNNLFILFHYPIEDWNGRYKGSIHLHGHCHGQLQINRAYDVNKSLLESNSKPHVLSEDLQIRNRFDVSVECAGYKPIHIDEILAKVVKV